MASIPSQMLYDWLSGPVMTELVASQDIAPGLPKPLPAAFYEFSPTNVVGVNVQYDAVVGVRTTAPIVAALSPAAGTDTQPRQRRQSVALGTRISTPLDSEFIMAMQSNVPLWADRAKTIMRQKQQDFRYLSDNLMISLVNSVICTGQISYNGSGQLLSSASGNVVPPQVSFQQLYAGSNQLNHASNWPNTNPGVPVGDWAITSTDIPSSLRAMGQGYQFTSNYTPMHILYGKNIPGYFYNNTAMQTYMSRQPNLNMNFMETNEVPAGLLDFQWHKGYTAYYLATNADGTTTTTKWLGDDQIVIFPDINASWYENVLCSMPCPTGLVQPGADVSTFLDSCPPVRGYSSYCIPCWNPIKLDIVSQLYTLPIIKNPYVMWSALVH